MTPASRQRRLSHLHRLIAKRKTINAFQDKTDRDYLRRINLFVYAGLLILVLINLREYAKLQSADNHASALSFYCVVLGGTFIMAILAMIHLIRTHRAMELFRLHKVENVSDIPGGISHPVRADLLRRHQRKARAGELQWHPARHQSTRDRPLCGKEMASPLLRGFSCRRRRIGRIFPARRGSEKLVTDDVTALGRQGHHP